MTTSNDKKICFISHGGGPMPLLQPESHAPMLKTLKRMTEQIEQDFGQPKAVLLISAHWEESMPTITRALKPELIYDYTGFEAAAYEIQYPCSGEPELAKQVYQVLQNAGIRAREDAYRGYDHGMFVPMKIMYPEAQIPCVQLSLLRSLSPSEHIKIGQALAEIDYPGLLIIGSGFSFHNMRAFFHPESAEDEKNNAFQSWLQQLLTAKEMDESERKKGLINWLEAPHARYCHPREEHLLPLHVCYGAAQKSVSQSYQVEVLQKQSSFFIW